MPKRRKLDAGAEERKRFYRFRDACYADRAAATKMLSEDRTLISIRNGIGETALHFLAVENDLSAVEWLFNRGADTNTKNDFGDTPLLEAAQLGYTEMCRFLLDKGADVYIRSNDETAISAAVTSIGSSKRSQEKTLALVTLLLEQLGEDDDINDFFGRLSAEEALSREDPISTLLVKRGLERPLWSE
jgi:ankyrin repeat protein